MDSDDSVAETLAAACTPRVRAQGPVGCHRREAADGRRVLSLIGFEGPVGDVQVRLPGGPREARPVAPAAADVALDRRTVDGETLVTLHSDARLALITWPE